MSSRMILSVMRVASDIKTLKWAVTAHLCQTDPQLPDDATTAEATTGARTATEWNEGRKPFEGPSNTEPVLFREAIREAQIRINSSPDEPQSVSSVLTRDRSLRLDVEQAAPGLARSVLKPLIL